MGGLDEEEDEDVVFLGTDAVSSRFSSLGLEEEVKFHGKIYFFKFFVIIAYVFSLQDKRIE